MLHTEKISNSTTIIQALDPKLKVFDVDMKTQFGSTYNSYLISGGEESVLIDTAKEKYFEEYIEFLKSQTTLEKIKYIIVNHTEPDHSGEIAKLLDVMPHLTVVGTPSALGFLKDISNKEFQTLEIKEGTTLQVGNKLLKFIIAPNLHWPDSMFTYLEDEQTLFTCDVFGAHYCTQKVYTDLVEHKEHYQASLKYYFDCIFGPFKEDVIKGLEKIKNLPLQKLAPSHGPIVRDNPEWFITTYMNWSNEEKVEEDLISIVYTSAYGYTKEMANEISRAIIDQGFKCQMFDLVETPHTTAVKEIKKSAAFLVGSPTLVADAPHELWNALLELNTHSVNGKLTAAFGSFGWSGEGVRNVESRLSQLKCEVIRPGLRIKFNPKGNESKLKKCYLFGEQFAKRLLATRAKKDSDWAKIKTGKWKCLVCGEIFEGEYPPEECPVCSAPSDQFVEINDEQINFKSDSNENIIILGGGIAGVTAAETIRKRSQTVNITIISEENELPYLRILLSKKICNNEISPIKEENWFKKNNIKLRLGEKVSKIDEKNNKILLESKAEEKFDKLIIATGAHACIIPILGDDKNGVFCLRDKKNFNCITEFVKRDYVQKAIIIGGGILGVEVASCLKKLGKEVEIIEFGPRIMGRLLDRHASILLQKHLESQGIKIRLNECVEEIYGTGEHFKEACAVKLKNSNETVEAQMIIRSTGVRPNLGLVKETSIEVNNGIIVNENMQTNIENIYACGDVCEFSGKMIGLWSLALEQAKIAGAQAIGDNSKTYYERPIATSFNGFGYKIFSIGDIGLCHPEKMYQILELSDPQNEIYRKFYFLDNQFVGGILMGDCKKAIQLRKAIDNASNIQTFLDSHFLDE